MGVSGAGKSIFLEILAKKRKKGVMCGTTLVTALYNILLRLPRDMSLGPKKFRTL